ncbi:MAG TPA: zinc ABC transporter substrate-binding protein [Tissierellaceae bacterium]|nr:zinc ABC transporter substrate-binding protein [Tissierellaceae bacterium]
MKSNMRKTTISLLLVFTLLLSSCGTDNSKTEDNVTGEDKLKIVSSFTIISNMTEQIGGDLVEVYNLVPTGTDPHEYEPMPDDIKAATDADLLFYNGVNLEGGESGWFWKMVESVGQDNEKIFNLNDGVEPKYLTDEDGRKEEINPHSYLDPKVGIKMTENLRDALIEIDPDNQDIYEENADEYLALLNEIDEKYIESVDSIPEENRILVTSERAFQYMTESYGLREAYVWEIDTEELGTTEQIKSLISVLDEEQPPVLFLESNVDSKPLETVSNESGIPIYEESIYSDEVGKKGDSVDSYIKLLEHNIDIIKDGLSE